MLHAKGYKNYSGSKLSLEKFILFLYFLYFVLSPFYLWKSGYPQVADVILVTLVILYFTSKRLSINLFSGTKRILIVGLFFTIYVFVINFVWIILLQNIDSFLLSSIYYVYNFLVVAVVISLYSDYGETLLKMTYYAVLISVFLQVIVFFSSGGFTGERTVGSFNNPNQLGYYSLLIVSTLMFLSSKINVNIILFSLGILSGILLSLLSLSKATIIAMSFLIILFLIFGSVNCKLKKRLWLILLTTVVIGVFINETTSMIQESELLTSVQNRINGIGQDDDDNPEQRGYTRLTDYPQYWIFGAGEGMYNRFSNFKLEFHSTLGNIQVSYGLIGSILFLTFIFLVLRNDKYRNWYIIISLLLIYGLTHNGIRNSIFWILLALIACSSCIMSKNKEMQTE